MSGNIPLKDQKILCTKSGNRCAIPKCRKELVIDRTEDDCESIIGEMAHIKGEKPTAPRYNSDMTDNERNSYENLIFVCGNCHKIIDDQRNTYTSEKLHEVKKQHEEWVLESTKKEVINVTFAELSIITKYLISDQPQTEKSYIVIPPKDKIIKNALSSKIEGLITMAMTRVKQVTEFIDKCPDIEFGENLKQGFVREYERLKKEEGFTGDELFYALLDFACGSSNDFKNKAAGLTVLVYLFEKCEVFEK